MEAKLKKKSLIDSKEPCLSSTLHCTLQFFLYIHRQWNKKRKHFFSSTSFFSFFFCHRQDPSGMINVFIIRHEKFQSRLHQFLCDSLSLKNQKICWIPNDGLEMHIVVCGVQFIVQYLKALWMAEKMLSTETPQEMSRCNKSCNLIALNWNSNCGINNRNLPMFL